MASSLNAGASPVIIAANRDQQAGTPLALLAEEEGSRVRWIDREFQDDDLTQLGRDDVDCVVDAVFVTLPPAHPTSEYFIDLLYSLARTREADLRLPGAHISRLCRRLRIPVNVADAPDLCTFTLLATYSDGPVHVGVTTSGNGCKLAARLRREIAAALPDGLGTAVQRLGTLRRRIRTEDDTHGSVATMTTTTWPVTEDVDDDDGSIAQAASFNRLVPATQSEDGESAKTRRARWLSQICEYWSLRKLVSLSESELGAMLEAYKSAKAMDLSGASGVKRRADGSLKSAGRIVLAGSGPGHPDLLTKATVDAIRHADLILADKLVPQQVLDLIPRRTEVFIARKFPGNADRAQEELLARCLDGLAQGRRVLRLKQGDPYLYGRGAEEVAFLRKHGYEPLVLPGITSAMSAPLFAAIPVTHRGAADQVLVCTGTGRNGVAPEPPMYVPTQTVVFLMALHRLPSLVESLTSAGPSSSADGGEGDAAPRRRAWPRSTPCAIIERASCADQRVIRSTLEHVCAAVNQEGSRPPGLLVLGPTCEALHPRDGRRWTVEEGFRGLDLLKDWRCSLVR
ncbi:hypothetical protein KEM52_002087 [Ascosphaera acerosa]|nr:hypothetical protein KEM52_002087 [Ascosphaera acerosa]